MRKNRLKGFVLVFLSLLAVCLAQIFSCSTPERSSTVIRLALVHMAPETGEIEKNRYVIEQAIFAAIAEQADWIITPELAESGYEFALTIGTGWIEDFPGAWLNTLAQIAADNDVSLFIGLPERAAATGLLYNSVAVINRQGAILGTYQKHQIVPGDLEGWSNPGLTTPLFVLDTIPIGLLICADAYTPDLANLYAGLGAKILLSSAAWYPGDMGPNGCWEECSLETQLPFVVCNRTGVEQYSGTDFSQSESAVISKGQRLFTFTSTKTKIFLVDWDEAAGTFTSAGALVLPF